MVHFWGNGIAQSLFRAYQSLESTCIGLIGRKLYCFSDMPIQLAATNRLHHRPPCSLNNEHWLSVYQITTKNIYCRRKCQNMRKNMRYTHFAKICEKCGKVPSMRQSHISVFLTCLPESGGNAAGHQSISQCSSHTLGWHCNWLALQPEAPNLNLTKWDGIADMPRFVSRASTSVFPVLSTMAYGI